MSKESVKRLNRKLRSRSENISMGAVFIFLVIFCIFVCFPFIWFITNIGKTATEFFLNPFARAEDYFSAFFSNVFIVLKDFDYASMCVNTLFFAIVPPLINNLSLSGVSYAYGLFDFRGKKVLHFLAILPMVVIIQGGSAGQMKLWLDLNFYDNPILAQIAAFSGIGYNMLIVGGFYSGCSRTYKEAAEMDGAGNWVIYWKIYFPMAFPLLATFFILSFIGAWNDFMGPRLYYPSWQTIATGIASINDRVTQGGSQWSRDYPKLFAAIFINSVPAVIMFASVQKLVKKIDVGGGIKA